MAIARRLEAALAAGALRLLRALGPVGASNLGGFVARSVGPFLPVSDVARRNLAMALPELSPAARERVVRGVWDNLGRTAAELPHVADLRHIAELETSAGPGYCLEGRENLPSAGPLVMVSAHLGNWEVLPVAAARLGLTLASFYRAASDANMDELIVSQRRRAGGGPAFAKGARGARGAVGWLRGGGALGMLVDQKMNDGIEARLFGQPAMTASAAAAFALRFDCPVIPARTVRLGPARLLVICEPALPRPHRGQRAEDVAALTQTINDRLETWIRDQPAQWLWLHRRWPKEVTAAIAVDPPRPLWQPAPPRRRRQS